MKVAILSDIHGNLPALEAVAHHIEQWQADTVVVAGDVVNRGPRSLACWQFVQQQRQQNGWHLFRGNHEEYVMEHQRLQTLPDGPTGELARLSYHTYLQFNADIRPLQQLTDGWSVIGPDGRELRIRHGSMQHNRDGIYPETDEVTIEHKIAPAPAVFVTAHTHKPFVRQLPQTLVVNTGSVGTPADGDGRASYAQLVWHNGRWQATIQRVAYNTDQTRQDYFTYHILEKGGPLSWLLFYEWQLASYVFPVWSSRYWTAVLAQEIDIETAVGNYLHENNLPHPLPRRTV